MTELTSEIYEGVIILLLDFSVGVSLTNAVHKTIIIFFKSKSKHEILAHCLQLRIKRADKTNRKGLPRQFSLPLASIFGRYSLLLIYMQCRSKLVNWMAHMYTDNKNNRFQKKLITQNTQ